MEQHQIPVCLSRPHREERRREAAPMAEAAQKQPNPTASRPVRCIVKLGGAAITNKGELESIDVESLRSACAQLRKAMSHAGATEKVVGMDWSRRPGDPIDDQVVDAEGLSGMEGVGLDTNFVVVHGAGSFGHFQASRSGVHKGGLDSTLVKAGFVATRISVTSLNQEIVRALAREGIPSVGMSPFACGWSTKQRKLLSANASQIIQSLHAGFVPVLHGDAVLDELLDCTILSGDVIIRHLAQLLSPKYVIFLTDVHGVYDRPPTDPNAVLLREIEVDDNGSWSIVKPALEGNMKGEKNESLLNDLDQMLKLGWSDSLKYDGIKAIIVEISVAAHDTTGGMETKILEAAVIARLGVDVYITKVGTEHSMRALKGDTSSEDWLGTVIRSSK